MVPCWISDGAKVSSCSYSLRPLFGPFSANRDIKRNLQTASQMQRSSWPVTAANMKILKRMQIWMKIWFPVLFRWTRPSHHLLISVSASFVPFLLLYPQNLCPCTTEISWDENPMVAAFGEYLVWLTCAFFRWGCWCLPPLWQMQVLFTLKARFFWHANRGTTFALRY